MPTVTKVITPTVATVTTINLGGSLNTLSVTNRSVTPDQLVYVFIGVQTVDRPSEARIVDAGETLIIRAEETSHMESGYTGKIMGDTIRLIGGGGAGAGLGVGTFGGGAGAAFAVTVDWTTKSSFRAVTEHGRTPVELG